MADEPMTDERLAEIRRYAEAIHAQRHSIEAVSSELVTAGDDLAALLAEVDRLRAALDTASQLIERLEEHADLPIAHPLNTAIDEWLRSIGI